MKRYLNLKLIGIFINSPLAAISVNTSQKAIGFSILVREIAIPVFQ